MKNLDPKSLGKAEERGFTFYEFEVSGHRAEVSVAPNDLYVSIQIYAGGGYKDLYNKVLWREDGTKWYRSSPYGIQKLVEEILATNPQSTYDSYIDSLTFNNGAKR